MSDIFISYAREDRAKAQQLALALENLGWEIWWDPHIPAGKTFDDVIEEALNSTRSVIVLWSPMSVGSRWVRTEAAEALDRGILVPVLIGDVQVPLAFKRVHAANLTAWDGAGSFPAFKKLVEDVSGVIGPLPGQVKKEELWGDEAKTKHQDEGEPQKVKGQNMATTEVPPTQSRAPRKGHLRRRNIFQPLFLFALLALVGYFLWGGRQVPNHLDTPLKPATKKSQGCSIDIGLQAVFHSEPSIFAPKLAIIRSKKIFPVISIQDFHHGSSAIPMYQVEFDGQRGWISNNSVDRVSPACRQN